LSGVKPCYSRCRDFSCTKKALTFRGKASWCQWLDEECTPTKCIYATCYKRQLLDNGNCGLTIKRRTQDDTEPEDFKVEELRAKGKLARKLGDRSIF
jgi:hypothetical protein